MNLLPGAVWSPISASLLGQRPARRKGRGLVGHVAVSNAHVLKPSSSSADWHFYVSRDGTITQFIDLDLVAWAQMNGNATMVSAESEGGVVNPDGEPWTDAQLDAYAHILRYLHDTEGVPLQMMPDSRPTSRGFAPHRWGVDPWRVSGGEVWSASRGKICPGAEKIAQFPEIIRRAGGAAPAPAPAPSVNAPPRLDFRAAMVDKSGRPLPANHYIGAIEGPNESHGGDARYDSDPVRGLVQNVLQWFIYHGCVPGVPSSAWNSSPGWTNTGWNAQYTDPVCVRWHERFYPNQPIMNAIFSDDYDRLARP
jgi:hypothetical protein